MTDTPVSRTSKTCANPECRSHACQEAQLRAVLRRVNEKLRAIVKPWEGVRADILPPAVVSIVPLCNELHAALDGGSDETRAVPSLAECVNARVNEELAGYDRAFERERELFGPSLKATACQCDPNPSIGGSPPCPVHDGESER